MDGIKEPDFKNLTKEEINKKNFRQISFLLNKGQYNMAEKKVNELIYKHPNNLIYQNFLAIIYASQTKFEDSIIILKKIIDKSPEFIDAHINLGNIYIDLNQLEKSAKCYEKVIEINPSNILASQNLAAIYDKQNRLKDASEIYSKLVLKEPNNLDLLNSYSGNQIKLGKLNNAKKILNDILRINPNYINAIINLGVVYKDEKKFEKAIQYYFLALKLQPSSSTIYYNLGNIYDEKNQIDKAIYYFNKAIKNNPTYIKAHYNLGCVLDKVGQTNEAILSYKKALKYNPKNIKALYNLARAQLATDDYKNGWKGFELREENTQASLEKLGITKKNIWDGNKFKGTLIVHAEQGVGDEILFSSMFFDLFRHHKDLIISVDDRLKIFFERSFPKIKFISRKKSIGLNYSGYNILAGSLGGYFRNSLNDFKIINKPWLLPNNKKVKEFKNHFYETKKVKVGVSWTTTGINDKKRIISLIDLVQLFPEDKFEIINLQYGNIKKDKKNLEQKEGRELIYFDNLDYTNDLESLAALICNCDLVVSIGSFTASFASVLGRKVWILVPSITTWCWHSNTSRTESLWFPNVKLFKQKNLYEWKYVFDLIKDEVNLIYKQNIK